MLGKLKHPPHPISPGAGCHAFDGEGRITTRQILNSVVSTMINFVKGMPA